MACAGDRVFERRAEAEAEAALPPSMCARVGYADESDAMGVVKGSSHTSQGDKVRSYIMCGRACVDHSRGWPRSLFRLTAVLRHGCEAGRPNREHTHFRKELVAPCIVLPKMVV